MGLKTKLFFFGEYNYDKSRAYYDLLLLFDHLYLLEIPIAQRGYYID